MKSIKGRLVFFYVILVVLVMMVSGTLIVTLIRRNAYNDLEKGLRNTVRVIKEGVNINASEKEVEEELVDTISKSLEKFSEREILLLDNEGREIYPNNGADRYYNHVVVASLHGIVSNEIGESYYEESTGIVINYREYAEPIIKNDKVCFVIYVKVPTLTVEESLRQTIFIILISVLIALALASALGTILAGTLTKPISALTKKARDMSKGRLDDTIEVMSNDEIGELTQNFNIMARELSKTLSEISSEKHKLEIVFSHMTDGILVFDANGELIHRNPASTSYLETKDKNNYDEILGDYLEVTFEEISVDSKEDIVQYIIKNKDKYMNLCFAPYDSKVNNSIGIVCVIQDITKHKRLEEMQKEFVANVSHELRTPITTIKSYAETLLNGAMEDSEITEHFLNVINSESDRMTTLVQDLLELSKLDNNQAQFDMKSMYLNSLLDETVDRYRILAEKKQQSITYISSAKDYIVNGDKNRIEQVIRNVISNAIKYSPEGTNIRVEIYHSEDEVIISVKDSGIGIPSEDIPRIFERFYRVDKARSRAMGGTGLGLAIAQEIMDYHGGCITVESDYGNGSCFYIKMKCIKTNLS